MLKQILKKLVPATFHKIESTSMLLLKEIRQLFSKVNRES